MKTTRLTLCTVAALALVLGVPALVADPPGTTTLGPSRTAESTEARPELIRVDPWQLLQSSGDRLYGELCATCHGAEGAGHGPAARSLTVYPPPLNTLARNGVPEDHWTYVILASCDDRHHWGPRGEETMPCWHRIFRQALGGTDAGPMLVSAKLATYLKKIQE